MLAAIAELGYQGRQGEEDIEGRNSFGGNFGEPLPESVPGYFSTQILQTLDTFVAAGFHSVGFSPMLRAPTGAGEMDRAALAVMLGADDVDTLATTAEARR